jgi:hypothetical protein
MQKVLMIINDKLLKLKDIVSRQTLPRDDHDHHFFLSPKAISNSSVGLKFDELVTFYVSDSNTKQRGPQQLADFRRHWEVVLMSLCQSIFLRKWLVILLDNNAYGAKASKEIKAFGFQVTALRDIVTYLEAKGLVDYKQGKKFKENPAATRIFPKAQLVQQLWMYFLDIEQDIKPPYVTIKNSTGGWGRLVDRSVKDHPDRQGMTIINDFLKSHKWACKGPVQLKYNTSAFEGGRLYTPYQALPDRKCRVRINTLIDDEPICEVDFNANHLRLNLAVLHSQDAGETPYEDIGELSKVDDRNRIKQFITVSMGASDEVKAFKALNKEGFNAELFDQIKQGTLKRYPKLNLFDGWGMSAQNLEGAILRKVMLEGIEQGIVSLPVHDAIAVKQGDAEWAKEAMERVWSDETLGGKTRLKVDFPE